MENYQDLLGVTLYLLGFASLFAWSAYQLAHPAEFVAQSPKNYFEHHLGLLLDDCEISEEDAAVDRFCKKYGLDPNKVVCTMFEGEHYIEYLGEVTEEHLQLAA